MSESVSVCMPPSQMMIVICHLVAGDLTLYIHGHKYIIMFYSCSTLVPTSSSHTVASFLNSLLYPSLLQPCIVNTVYYSHLITFCTYSFFQFHLLLKPYLAINSHMHPTVPIYSSEIGCHDDTSRKSVVPITCSLCM